MRTYTVDGKVYSGFNRSFPVTGFGTGKPELTNVVLITDEGELDAFAVDDPKKVSGLLEYLTDHHPNANILGCFQRIK